MMIGFMTCCVTDRGNMRQTCLPLTKFGNSTTSEQNKTIP